MVRFIASSFAVFMLACMASNVFAQAPGWGRTILTPRMYGERYADHFAQSSSWHGNYYYLRTGQPTALVVPPNIVMQSNYSWGVSQNTMTPVYHQFKGLPPTGAGGGLFRATPVWPSHTDQFGIYPVRAPW